MNWNTNHVQIALQAGKLNLTSVSTIPFKYLIFLHFDKYRFFQHTFKKTTYEVVHVQLLIPFCHFDDDGSKRLQLGSGELITQDSEANKLSNW